MSFGHFVYTQLSSRPPYPTADFSGKTVIVTGANVGLGKEAVKHLLRLNTSKVIMAVRNIQKGEAAKVEIEAATKRVGKIDVWELDLAKYASVQAFAARVAQLARVDAFIANAGIATETFEVFEDNESSITVNVVSTMLLVLLLLPTMRSYATKWDIAPVIAVVNSGVHAFTKFPERKATNSLATLNNKETANMPDRYPVSKLLQAFAVREIADKTSTQEPRFVLNMLDPGLCYTDLTRSATGKTYYVMKIMRKLLAWTAEEGSRCLVFAATAGPASHGVYISEGKLRNNGLSSFVTSAEGQKTQKKVWSELVEKLEQIQPGITAGI